MRFFILIIVFFLGFSAWSQERYCHRVAHVDVEYILAEWVEVQKVDSIIYGQKKLAEKSFRPTFDRYQFLYEAISDGQFTGLDLENKVLELEQLEAKVTQYNFSLKNTLVSEQQLLMRPLFSKVKSTINFLAKSGDYDYVLSSVSKESSLVLYSKSDTDDLTAKVLELLYQK